MKLLSIVCEWCASPADVAYCGHGQRPLFCSPRCRQAARKQQHDRDNQARGAARMRAYRQRRAASQPQGA